VSFTGRMRCLAALARWEELNSLCKEYWIAAEPAARLEMAPMVRLVVLKCLLSVCLLLMLMFLLRLCQAANAAWNMGEWDQMADYVSRLDDGDETKLRGLGNTTSGGDGSSNGTFFRAVLLVRRGKVCLCSTNVILVTMPFVILGIIYNFFPSVR
jgi:FKBP12-rapamycin complex-associated protein